MNRCIARWDNGKTMKVLEQRSEALKKTANSRLEGDATLVTTI